MWRTNNGQSGNEVIWRRPAFVGQPPDLTSTTPVATRGVAVPDIEASFTIDQPVGRVWEFFQDVPEVVTCMPGTELIAQTGESTYKGKVTVKLGPVTAAFEGEATIVEAGPRLPRRPDRRHGHRPPRRQPGEGEHHLRDPRARRRLPRQALGRHQAFRRTRPDRPRRHRPGCRQPPRRTVLRAPSREARAQWSGGGCRCRRSGSAPGYRRRAPDSRHRPGVDQALGCGAAWTHYLGGPRLAQHLVDRVGRERRFADRRDPEGLQGILHR